MALDWLPAMVGLIGAVLVLMVVGLPVAVAFLIVDVIAFWVLGGPSGLTLLVNSIYESVTNVSLAPVLFFILLGEVLFRSGSVEIILDAVDKCAGNIRARLIIVCLIAATIFGALSGVAMGVAAMLGASLLPEMKRKAYDAKLSVTSILAGASLAPIIPPSSLGVLVAIQANISVAKLLMGGILPGILISAVCITYIFFLVKMKPHLAPTYSVEKVNMKDKAIALARALPFSLIIVTIIGFILWGVASPTEAAASGALASFVLAALYRRFNLVLVRDTLINTMKVGGAILFIVAGSKAFSQVLAITGSTKGLMDTITDIALPPILVFLVLQLIVLVLGAFIDQISIILISVPVYMPIVATLGFDPIWFWVIFLINLTIGGVTPPFGLVLYTLKGATRDISLEQIFQSGIQTTFIFLIGMVILILFPVIVTWLPNLIK